MYTKSKFVSLPQDINIDEILILTITHLNIQKKAELIKYLLSIINKKIKTNEYERSIEFVFEEKQLFLDTYDKLEKSKDIVKFGFNKVIIFGVNTGQITFDNYDRKQYREFKDYIAKSVGVDMKRC